VKNPRWGRSTVDRFILAGLEVNKLAPSPAADRRTLIRRATFDLLGLPPAPDEVDAFLHDARPSEQAFADLVERLLASPHYGERWARHWLDVVRYADSGDFASRSETVSSSARGWAYQSASDGFGPSFCHF
jgi:hypothetical protein